MRKYVTLGELTNTVLVLRTHFKNIMLIEIDKIPLKIVNPVKSQYLENVCEQNCPISPPETFTLLSVNHLIGHRGPQSSLGTWQTLTYAQGTVPPAIK